MPCDLEDRLSKLRYFQYVPVYRDIHDVLVVHALLREEQYPRMK